MNFSKGTIFKWSLIFLIIITCIADIATFFWGGLYEFDINPLMLLLKPYLGMTWSIIAAISIKVLIIIGISAELWLYTPKKQESHMAAFIFVYIGIFCILLQILGTYGNVTTTVKYQEVQGTNVTIVPLSTEQTTTLYLNIGIIYYVMSVITLLSFYIYEKIYRLYP